MKRALERLRRWLVEDAYPIWWEAGAHRENGFFDRLDLSGAPTTAPRRLRVQARQAFAFALAPRLGWSGPAEAACRLGLEFLSARRQADGLYRPGPTSAYAELDGMGELYDQGFVLLALASGQAAFGADLERQAAALQGNLAAFAHPLGGYAEAPSLAEPLFANPNMHLFESFLAWALVSDDPAWARLADGLGELALNRLIDPASGLLGEAFTRDWGWPSAPVIWPGHLYEWAWLLMRWRPQEGPALAAALRLTELAETHGVDPARKVAIFALDGALRPTDRTARLWAQTERIKATALAASLTGDDRFRSAAAQACEGLEAFFEVPTPGLWRDRMLEDGSFVEEAAPASSFYHIVGAIAELDRLAGSGAL
jgi:mannose-6-phosphate isomerase